MKTSRLATATAFVATAAVSAAAGWSARAPVVSTTPPPLEPARTPTVTAVPVAPLIAVSSDGYVTLRVEQQPLEWVLEQIAAQGGLPEVKAPVHTASAAHQAPAPETLKAEVLCAPSTLAPADPAQLLQALQHPGETQRHEALMQARSNGIVVPEATLKALMDADPSERVRLAAFESLLESRWETRIFLETLQAAQYAPSTAIRNEARRRLAELQEMERVDAQLTRAAPS